DSTDSPRARLAVARRGLWQHSTGARTPHYALYEPGKRGSKNDGRLIFPRFHQLRAVERIVDDIEHRGPGGRYLVWHSAGSGKTKTIAWLSHRLIRHMNDQSKATFDSVIVVTDRTVLDENIR